MNQEVFEWWCVLVDDERFKIIEEAYNRK